MDHWYQPDKHTITLLTVLVYFNGDLEGGETRFCEQLDETIIPSPGLTAIFQHKVRHEGCEVRRGTKYAVRSDVFYSSEHPIELTFDDAWGRVRFFGSMKSSRRGEKWAGADKSALAE